MLKSLPGVPRRPVTLVRVRPCPGRPKQGRVLAGPLVARCALGRSGLIVDKREGDGGTPVGRFGMLAAFHRADRIRRFASPLPLRGLAPSSGWCDDPDDRCYNRPVRLPYAGRHERLRRDDGLYDIVIDLSYNRGPIRRGRGSAIFLHCARADLAPTEGCVALPRDRLRKLLGVLSRRAILEVGR